MAKNWYAREHARKSNAAKKAAYILREGGYKTKEGERFLGGGSENLPTWAASAQDFWMVADKYERNKHNDELDRTAKIKDHRQRRKKRAELAPQAVTVAREYEIPLPRELSDKQCVELARALASQIGANHAYTWGVHRTPGGLSGIDNPHVHIMLSERTIDNSRPEPGRAEYFKKSRTLKSGKVSGGYKKDLNLRRIGHVSEVKGAIKQMTNSYLKEQGIDLRIDFRGNPHSLGHLGAATIARAATGKPCNRMDAYIATKIAPARQAEKQKEQQIKAKMAAEPTMVEAAITKARITTAYILHPFNKTARSHKLQEIAKDDIAMRLLHTKRRSIIVYAPKEIAWIPSNGWPCKDPKTGHINMIMGEPDNYKPLTPAEILSPTNFSELIAWERKGYGAIGLKQTHKSSKAVYTDKLTHDIETQRRQLDEKTDRFTTETVQNLNAWAHRNRLPGQATIKAPTRPGRDKTRKYFTNLENRKAYAQAEESSQSEALTKARATEAIRAHTQEEQRQQEAQRSTTHSHIIRRNRNKGQER